MGQRIVSLRTWGKHFLIEFADFTAPHPFDDVRPLLHQRT